MDGTAGTGSGREGGRFLAERVDTGDVMGVYSKANDRDYWEDGEVADDVIHEEQERVRTAPDGVDRYRESRMRWRREHQRYLAVGVRTARILREASRLSGQPLTELLEAVAERVALPYMRDTWPVETAALEESMPAARGSAADAMFGVRDARRTRLRSRRFRFDDGTFGTLADPACGAGAEAGQAHK